MFSGENYFIFLVLLEKIISVVYGENVHYELTGESCLGDSKVDVGPHENVILKWKTGFDHECRMSFTPRGDDVADVYEICVETSKIHIEDCKFEVKIWESNSQHFPSTESRFFRCEFESPPEVWCSSHTNRPVFIGVNYKSKLLDEILDSLPSILAPDRNIADIELKVFTKEVYNVKNAQVIAMYMGIAGGCVVGFIFVVFIVYMIIRSRHRYNSDDEDEDYTPPRHYPVSGTAAEDTGTHLVSPSADSSSSHSLSSPQIQRNSAAPPAYHDLGEMPPTYDEVMALEQDSSQDK